MATPQNSGNTPARSNDNQEQTRPSPFDAPDLALEAAAAEAGEHPERTAAIAKELGLSESDSTDATEMVSESPQSERPKLKLQNPNEPMRVSHDSHRNPVYAFQLSDGLLVRDDYYREEDRTEYFDLAWLEHTYPNAIRMRTLLLKHLEEEVTIVTLLVGYNGIPYGVRSVDEQPKAHDFGELDRYTACLAQAAAFENEEIGLEAFCSFSTLISYSPLWPLIAAQFQQDLASEEIEKQEEYPDGADLRLFTRGFMAGIQLERMLHRAKNKYGELVTDVPQRGEVQHNLLKERRPLVSKGGAR